MNDALLSRSARCPLATPVSQACRGQGGVITANAQANVGLRKSGKRPVQIAVEMVSDGLQLPSGLHCLAELLRVAA
jgi:hypothetical protein